MDTQKHTPRLKNQERNETPVYVLQNVYDFKTSMDVKYECKRLEITTLHWESWKE